jgi:superfamily II DNA or RNA helicase
VSALPEYTKFLAGKLALAKPSGFAVESAEFSEGLFHFQADLVKWALRRGRAAIFASTGLGKTRMQLEWARQVREHAGGPVLVLAPLAVAAQTVAEGALAGIDVTLAREQSDCRSGINATNYERLHRFDPSTFAGVVLDESSCIKHFGSKTLTQLLEAFGRTEYRLCATATPAPNDYTELGTHAEFLGVCSRAEMLAEFFCHDGGETQVWRLKGHARKQFWKWVASWGALVRAPSDLGYDDGGYNLPPLKVEQHLLGVDQAAIFASGELFAPDSQTLMERRGYRKDSLADRVASTAALVNEAADEPWIVWCDLNAEADALMDAIPDAVEVRGSDDIDVKEARLLGFAQGKHRVLVTKSSIAGFGLNWQHCARVAFVGLTDSWESYFQAIRRCWRFGQRRAVEVHVFASELEGAVVKNLERKARDAEAMAKELSLETAGSVRAEVIGSRRLNNDTNHRTAMKLPSWIQTRGA